MAPQNTRPDDPEDATGTATRTLPTRGLRSPLQALAGVVLLVGAARTARGNRRRAALLALAGGGLLAAWVRRTGPPTPNDPAAPATPGDHGDEDVPEASTPEVVADDDASNVVEADDDVPAPDVDETDDRM